MEQNEILLEAKNVGVKIGYKTILDNLNFKIEKGKTYAVVGASGSGKTTLAEVVGGEIMPTSGTLSKKNGTTAVFVPQQDRFISSSGVRVSYYGQRYENPNEEGIPTVEAYCRKVIPDFVADDFNDLLEFFNVSYLPDRQLLSLSNGERKRVQLIISFLRNSDVQVFDQPFTGLDVQSRQKLGEIIETKKADGHAFVMVCNADHVPPYVDFVFVLNDRSVSKKVSYNKFQTEISENKANVDATNFVVPEGLVELKDIYECVVKMKAVNVSFAGKTVLSDINWDIKQGERWLLRGHNGAGKSTLLSLVTADNPQGYSNDLVLFDKQRGSGETIWDIKHKIGFVSPELHLYFIRRRGLTKVASNSSVSSSAMTNLDVVLSGFKDEIGFNTTRSKFQVEIARKWLRIFNMEQLADAPFQSTSLGEQRILLLVRALIKSPGLLVLDEPCQGLDPAQVKLFTSLLDSICASSPVTMIYVTHNQEQVPSCVTRVLELKNGAVVNNK